MRRSRLALPCPRNRQIIQNFRQVRSGDHVVLQSLRQRIEHFLRVVRLAKEKPANTRGEDRFHIAVVSLGHSRVPRKRGIAVAAREIRFAQGEVRFRPFRFEARRFPQFAQTHIIFAGQQPATVVFKRIETQRTLALRELGKTQRIVAVVCREHPPNQTGVQVHKRVQRTGFPQPRQQSCRTYLQDP